MKGIRGITNPVAVEVTGINAGDDAYDKDKKLEKGTKIAITVKAGSGETKHGFTLMGEVLDDPAPKKPRNAFDKTSQNETNQKIRITKIKTPEGNEIIVGGTARGAVRNSGVLLHTSDLNDPKLLNSALTDAAGASINPFQEAFMEYASQKKGKTVAALDASTLDSIAAVGLDLLKTISNMMCMGFESLSQLSSPNTKVAQTQSKNNSRNS